METNLLSLIQGCDQLLEDRQYSETYKVKIHNTWDKLEAWMGENYVTEFNKIIGHDFCDDILGGHLINPEWDQKQKQTLRAVRMLISFQSTGTFEFRSPRKEYQFYGETGAIALEFLQYLQNDLKRSMRTLENKRSHLEKLCVYLNIHSIGLADINSSTILDLFESDNFTEASRRNAAY